MMKEICTKYQAVLFGSWEEIKPQATNLSYFLDKFSDKNLVPVSFENLIPNIPNGVVNTFQLKSSDNIWTITFNGDRIDIHKINNNVKKVKIGAPSTFTKEVVNICDIILEKFPRKLNRISLITQYRANKIPLKDAEEIFIKLTNPIDFYSNNKPVNWNTRAISRVSKSINKKSELLNIISQINRVEKNLSVQEKSEQVEAIELNFDINTFQGNQEYRLEKADIVAFYKVALTYEKMLKKSYFELFSSK